MSKGRDHFSISPQRRFCLHEFERDVSQISVMNADGTNVRQLTNGNADDVHPTWESPCRQLSLSNRRRAFGNADLCAMGPKLDRSEGCRR